MAEPTRTQIQAIIDTKIVSIAVDSDKTMGSGVKAIYTALLDVLYEEGPQTEQEILNLILDNIFTGSLRGDVITGNGLTEYFNILTAAVFGDYPNKRVNLEDKLLPYLRNVSRRTDVTIGQTLRDITKLILDKIYNAISELPEAPAIENLTAIVLSESEIELRWEYPAINSIDNLTTNNINSNSVQLTWDNPA